MATIKVTITSNYPEDGVQTLFVPEKEFQAEALGFEMGDKPGQYFDYADHDNIVWEINAERVR